MKKLLYKFKVFLLTAPIVLSPSLLLAQSRGVGGRGGGGGILGEKFEVNATEGEELVSDMLGALLSEDSVTGQVWAAGCYVAIIVTILLGAKQFFIKTDEQDRGGFFNIIKVGGWALMGLLGLWLQNIYGT
jgi:hypothetical protein